jgi:hypothetical protein
MAAFYWMIIIHAMDDNHPAMQCNALSKRGFIAVEVTSQIRQNFQLANSPAIHFAVRATPSCIDITGAQFNSSRAKLLLSTFTGTSNGRPGK